MKAYGFQWDIIWENKEANFEKSRELVSLANPAPGSLLVLPEMFATGFSMSAEVVAEDFGGPTRQFLGDLARSHQCWVIGGAAIRDSDTRPRNTCLVFAPSGQLVASYAKMRPFSPGGESDHYAAGDRVCVFDWNGCPVAPFVCYDLRFPELFREAARMGAPQLFVVIASWPAKRVNHWVRLLQARAIENQACVIGVNRIGADPFFDYAGRSIVLDPHGEIIADAEGREGAVSAELDLDALARYREGLPFLKDMR